MVRSPWSRAVIVTPGLDGTDGVSAVSRLYVQALAAQLDNGLGALAVWSLAGHRRPAALEGIRIVFRGAGGNRLAFGAFALRETAIDASTLVVVQHLHLLPVTLPLMLRGARVLLLLHGVEAWRPFGLVRRAVVRRAWRVVAVSAHTAARFHASNPTLADVTVRVCPSGVAWPGPAANVSIAGRYALIVGRMAADERYKGHDQVIDLWPRVRARVPDAQLVIAGGGDDRARLAAKVHALGLNGAVRFEGVVSEERLAALYHDARVFVMPSPNEGLGLVYLEAMRAGTPCIVARGAAEEIVEDGVTGLVVDLGDRAALESSLVRMLGGGPERDRMGQAAADVVRRRFTAALFATRLYDLLDLPPVASTC